MRSSQDEVPGFVYERQFGLSGSAPKQKNARRRVIADFFDCVFGKGFPTDAFM